MTQTISINNYNILKNIGTRNVKVNDKEYECRLGLETEGGFYRNGWTAKEVDGLKGKFKYIRFLFYTSASERIDIEEKWLIRSDGKVMERRGWNDVNLKKMCKEGECSKDMDTILKDFKN
jgi:hypothetical protein